MLGAHLSVAGGYVNALIEAKRLRCETVQIFTKNQRQWRTAPPDPAAVNDWLAQLRSLGWTHTVSHASYLINLAGPSEEFYRRSIDSMTDEIERAEALSIPYVVVHPGSHMNGGEEAGIRRIVAALDEILRRTSGCRAIVCLETTVGGGTQIGGRFEHLAAIRSRVRHPQRIGTCFDTCHVTAAGYDLSTPDRAAAVFDEFDTLVGLEHLHCFHFNDSKYPLGSRRDRHEHIGDGYVGRDAFRFILNDPRFAGRPKVIETEKGTTEKGTSWDTINLRRLRRLGAGRGQGSGVRGQVSVRRYEPRTPPPKPRVARRDTP